MNRLFLIFIVILSSCRNVPEAIEISLQSAGPARGELEKVVKHYTETGEKVKLKAAYFIIENINDQYHYEGRGISEYKSIFSTMDSIIKNDSNMDHWKTWDSIQLNSKLPDISNVNKVADTEIITANYIIHNIDQAFIAWGQPWAKDLTFDQFCQYILPYKAKNEGLEYWRPLMLQKYKWLPDSMRSSTNPQEACRFLNKDLMKNFYINARFSCSWDLTLNDLLRIKTGTCEDATQFTLYVMRAMGVPVAMDFTPLWGNKNGGHGWNALIYKNKSIHFVGSESNPGMDKVQFTRSYWMKRKLAKVFRRTYKKQIVNIIDISADQPIPSHLENSHVMDVTSEYVPVSSISLIDSAHTNFNDNSILYLCVFNNQSWQAIHWAAIKNNEAHFKDMGRDIVYMPASYSVTGYTPLGAPFIVDELGNKIELVPKSNKKYPLRIYKKYPEDNSNNIIPGETYELFYWNKRWISLGTKKARSEYLDYTNIPESALLLIRNVDKGFQERIFTVKNGSQVWW